MQKAPYLSTLFVLAGLAALGLPATMGFVGELTILISAIERFGLGLMIIALGSMVGAGYIIWTFRRVIYGEMSEIIASSTFKMNCIEFLALILFAILILFFGLFPSALFDVITMAFIAPTGGLQ